MAKLSRAVKLAIGEPNCMQIAKRQINAQFDEAAAKQRAILKLKE